MQQSEKAGGDLAVEEGEQVCVESLPRLDSYQRILCWLSHCQYEQQNLSYTNEDHSDQHLEDDSGRKKLKEASKSCHPKKLIRSNFFKSKAVDSFLSTTTFL